MCDHFEAGSRNRIAQAEQRSEEQLSVGGVDAPRLDAETTEPANGGSFEAERLLVSDQEEEVERVGKVD